MIKSALTKRREFNYESDVRLTATKCKVDWKISFSDGRVESKHTVYQKER
ncbi:MAG: hypothetical protein R8K53_00650 [Mariprofundaceae bacterium]